jgi:hypothetical protein
MIAIVTVLVALPLGYLVRSRLVASTTYAVLYLWAFGFQSVYLLLEAMDGSTSAFRPGEFPVAYGVMTLLVLGVGLALVRLGGWARSRRGVRAPAPVG